MLKMILKIFKWLKSLMSTLKKLFVQKQKFIFTSKRIIYIPLPALYLCEKIKIDFFFFEIKIKIDLKAMS